MTHRVVSPQIELFTAQGCTACERKEAGLRLTIAKAGPEAELILKDVVEHLDRAVELGIRQLPALAVNSRLVPLTGAARLRRTLEEFCREDGA